MRANIHEEENILMFAFRYALGRRTGAPDAVVNIIERNWDIINKDTEKQMQEEIVRYGHMFHISDTDWPTWKRILNLKIRD